MIKAKNSLILLLLLGFLQFGCQTGPSETQSGNTDMANDSIGMVASDTSSQNNDSKSTGNETDALAILNAINENEINAAAEARSKNISKSAKDYADMLHKEHTDNFNKTLQLASSKGMTLADNNTSTDMKRKGDAELDKIKVLEGKEFEEAYIDMMISGHTEALNVIDTQLMGLATSDDVRQHLTDTRGHVAKHLEQAQKLKSQSANR